MYGRHEGSQLFDGQRGEWYSGTCQRSGIAYLRSLSDIHEGFTFLVRLLEPGQVGIPLQIYVFTKTTKWVEYEGIQADIFDHLLAALPEFGLRAFQEPSGYDVAQASGSAAAG